MGLSTERVLPNRGASTRSRVKVRTVFLCASLLAAASAQAQREVSINYLRAALGSLSDRERIAFEAVYAASDGMDQATETPLRGKGYSRLTLRDPNSGATFDDVYCEHDSRVFNTLLPVQADKRFRFEAYKDQGERRVDAIFLTAATPVRTPPAEAASPPPSRPTGFRVTMIDHSTSNRTVLVNIELGKPYNLMGTTLLIEAEDETGEDPGRVQVR